jgi:hypothetical protein
MNELSMLAVKGENLFIFPSKYFFVKTLDMLLQSD